MTSEHKIKTSFGYVLIFFMAVFVGVLYCPNVMAQEAGVWPEVSSENKPWARWWWMGNAVDSINLKGLMDSYEQAGLGGLEIAPIYGAKGFEDRYLEFLSKEWMDMLHYTVELGKQHRMGIDLTQGTGWPFGGPQVTPEMAATRMVVQEHGWKGGNGLDRPVVLEDKRAQRFHHGLIALMAYHEDGRVEELTGKVDDDGSLHWEDRDDWELLAVFQAQTGQLVKRAAPGGQGFTLDHFSKNAVAEYLKSFGTAFGENTPGIRALYNDSFEVYGSDFTGSFFDEFEKRRGYDLKQHLPILFEKSPSNEGARLKSDYRETIHEMLLENFTHQWTDWAHEKGKKTKNQAHGSPGNLLDLYAAVDIPEGETFGSSYFPIPGIRRDSADIRNVDPDPLMLKFASSAAHMSGKNLVSSETFTWLGEHFKSSFSQAKPELEQAFLAGINHMFYHGVTYSPLELDFPGWLFYASINLNTHNSLWPHFKGFNAYISRSQSVLQAGRPDNEIWMYWPVYDAWADPKGLSKMLTVHDIDEWLHPTAFYEESKMLMEKGYSLDFISDALLKDVEVVGKGMKQAVGRVLVVPMLHFLPLSTLESILDLASRGALVVFQGIPQDVPGFMGWEERKEQLAEIWRQLPFTDNGNSLKQAEWGQGKVILSGDLVAAMNHLGVKRESLVDSGLKFIRRDLDNGKYYYLVNHTAGPVDEFLSLTYQGKSVVLMDPQQGSMGLASIHQKGDEALVRVQLDAGEAMTVHVSEDEAAMASPWNYADGIPEMRDMDGGWQLTFVAGGPELPAARELKKPMDWTSLGDNQADVFSGQATYETNFNIELEKDAKYVLDLGDVRESARVWVNGADAGYAFGIPFKLDVSQYLREGSNSLKVEVANLMANRIRDLDQRGIEWRNYHEINFVNIDYKPFDASDWKIMPSGLVGPVKMNIYR